MSTKLFIIAIGVIGIVLAAGVYLSLSQNDSTAPSTSTGKTDTTYTAKMSNYTIQNQTVGP